MKGKKIEKGIALRGSVLRYALGAMRHADVHPHLYPPPSRGRNFGGFRSVTGLFRLQQNTIAK